MAQFGTTSKALLEQAHPDLRAIAYKAIEVVDHKITCTKRGKEEQDKAFREGKSKLKYPDSKHNKEPFSLALDLVNFPVNWNKPQEFKYIACVYLGIAHMLGIKLRLGWDWNGDLKENDSFIDSPHLELHSKMVNGVEVLYK